MLNTAYLSKFRCFCLLLILIVLISCVAVPNLKDRQEVARQIALGNNLKARLIKTDNFNLFSFFKINDLRKPLNVYIECDGYAWKNNHHPSKNPTPINPIALKMASVDLGPNILYIARPCQYVDLKQERNCQEKFWTDWRFSSLVIDSVNQVIDDFLNKSRIKSVNLYGYSGGAAVALLVASKRNDVKSIKTIAGNLNPQLLNQIHGVSPLEGSLNPIDYLEKIKNIPQLHIAGAKDNIAPADLTIDFVSKIKAQGGVAEVKLINQADHEYQKWPEIWSENLI